MQNIDEFLALHNISRIRVGTPFPVGPVNSYLIKSAPYTLIDPGPDTDEARHTLAAGLEKAGVKPEQVERVVITHYHADHSGLANWFNSISGAGIIVHKLEARKLQPHYNFYTERIPFLREAGLSEQEINALIKYKHPELPVLPKQNVTLVNGGESLEFSDRNLRVIHVPGHSSGHIGLYDEESQIFFAGDFILKNSIPGTIIEAREPDFKERLPVLSLYLNSLKLFAGLPVKTVLPGHGSIVEGNVEISARILKYHQEKLEAYLSLINGRKISAYQLMSLLYPEVQGLERSLAISQVIACLDYLVSAGRLRRELHNGVYYYTGEVSRSEAYRLV